MNKIIFHGLILLLTLTLTLGAVSAQDNLLNETNPISLEAPVNDIQSAINDEDVSHSDSDALESMNGTYEETLTQLQTDEIYLDKSIDRNLLGINIEEDNILQKTIILNDNYFRHVRDAINMANDGDTIDLNGKTIIAAEIGGNSKIVANNLKFINGVFDAGNVSPITGNMRTEFYNCILENVTFINYREAYTYGMIIIQSELRHVNFKNFTVDVAGFVVRNCNFTDVNFTDCHSLIEEDENDYETGAMVVAYNSNIDKCNFVNCTTNRHSGAICVAGQDGNIVNITNSNFINCGAGIGGAIYVHGNAAITEDYHSNIINCTFIGNTATERGGAIGSSQNYLIVENCLFENNTAKRGAAYMLAGINHGLDGITEGHYNTMLNCTFKNNIGTEEGGAVHITGNNNKAINCTFWDNYATEGNGSAIYVHGENSSVINSKFYNHECSRGTVYVIGNNTVIDASIFENNSASRGGAGVYVDGDNTLVNNSVFNNNTAVYHGGAVHSHGDNLRITNSNFTSNHAFASTEDIDQGLGGAVYIKGNNSDISFSNFEYNVARNGSAVYNRGRNLTLEDDTFIENQAWSYLITGITNDKRFYYDPEGIIIINVTHKGGDNIINAIHNDGSPDNIFFKNVTYESSVNNQSNTGSNIINPVDGVENSQHGTLIYQDDREDLQNITIIVTHLETGKTVIDFTSQTGIYGNLSVSEKGLLPGNYSVNVTHFEDGLYKYITNITYFEILPVADLAIEKLVSNKTPNLDDEIIWTIKVTNNGPNNVSDAYVIDKLPDGLIFNGADGNYDETTYRWEIGTLNVDETKILNIKTIVNITNTTLWNVAVVNSGTYDPNETNNVADNTTKSNTLTDLSVIKLVSQKFSVIGDTLTWTIKVTNNGPDVAVNAYAIDVLPSGVSYVGDDSKGKYNPTTGRWNIGDLAKGATAILNIKTLITKSHTTIVNNVFVNSTTPDSNMSNNYASNDTTVLESNFIVEKHTITPLVALGDQVKFQIIVKNTGLTNLTNLFIEEFSYDGLIFDHALNQSHWTHSIVNGKNRWTLNDKLGIDQVTILTVLFNTTKVGTFTNVVVAGSDETDNRTTKNDTTVVKPSLSVEKITITPLVSVGEQVIFEIIIKNTGLVNLTNAFVEEFSYDGLIFDHANTHGFWVESVVNGKTRWTYDFELAPEVTHGFTVVFNTTKVGTFTNVVVAGSDNADNKTAKNDTTVVKPEFSVEKISLNDLVSVGEQVTFEIVVTNNGLVDLTDVVVTEKVPEGLIFDHAYGLGHWKQIGDYSWIYEDTFHVNQVHGFFVVFNTTKSGTFTNVVVVKANNTDNKTAKNDTTVVTPEFIVEKICLDPIVPLNNLTKFQITVRNVGQTTLTGVFIEETDYEGLTYMTYIDTEGWTYNYDDTNPRWELVTPLNPNFVATLTVVFNATQTGNWTNTVTVGADKTDNKTANDTTEVREDVPEDPDKNATNPNLSVEKIASQKIILTGQQVTFEIIVKNTGDKRLHNVTVHEQFDEGLTFANFRDISGLWIYNGDLTFTYNDTLHVGETISFYVIFNTDKTGNFTNYVTVTSNETDNKTNNDTVEIVDPQLIIDKVAIDKIAIVGSQVTFEILVRNTGKLSLNNVVVSEDVPDGLVYADWYDDTGLWRKNDDLTWSLSGSLLPNEYVGFFVVFNTTSAGSFTNVIVVSSDEVPNKTSNDTVEVFEPELVVNKVAIDKTVNIGQQVTFEILVRNEGKVSLNNVVVSEDVSDALVYADWYDDTGLWRKNDDLSWSLSGSLLPNEYVGFFVVFNTTSAGSFTNVIVVSSDEVPNKTSNDTVKVLKPDFTVEKLTVNNVILLGDEAYFEIIIKNTGEVTLHNFTVYETFFEGLEYDNWYDDTGLWSKNNDLSWTFNSYLTPGVYTGFFVSFKTTKVGHFTNMVVVTNDLISNKTANDTVDVIKPEFSVEKVTVNQIAVVGEQVIFEIIVNNYGNVDLTNLIVYEKEFEGLIYDSWFDYTYYWVKNDDLSWTYNSTLEAKKTADFYVVFNTTKMGNFTNVVVVSSVGSDNKTANDTVKVIGADLSVIKLVSNKSPNYGDEITWTIIVTNNGPANAKDVYVADKLPSGLLYQFSKASIGSYDPTTGIWTIGQLDSGSTVTLEISTIVKISNTAILNVATVNSTVYDPNPENNIANNTTSVNSAADLSIEKIVMEIQGRNVTWMIIVTNLGPDTAINARAIDILPDSLQLISFDLTKGSFNPETGVWTIGDLSNGEKVALIIKTAVNATGIITNEARVESDTYDPNITNNYDYDVAIVEDKVPDIEPPLPTPKNSDVIPAAGNPLILVLLALLALCGLSIRRKD